MLKTLQKINGEKLIGFLVFLIIFTVYSPWIFHKEIIGGDWPYYYKEMLQEARVFTPLWQNYENLIGGVSPNFPLLFFQNLIISLFVNFFHLSWSLVSKLFFFFLFIVLSIVSSFRLSSMIFSKKQVLAKVLTVFIYLTNSYILLIAGGGQIGIMLSYALAPLVMAQFISFVEKIRDNLKEQILKESLTLGLLLAMAIMFDLRIAYLTLLICGFYLLFNRLSILRQKYFTFLFYSLISFLVVIGLHFFWLFPFIKYNLLQLPKGLLSQDAFTFFSFADFSHTLSFLHPNWPENIFGKVDFMKPEFILIPIIVFLSLFLINKGQKKKEILFFILLGLVGSFLAKGKNLPLGEINTWLFVNIPGMNFFRDSTKFFLLIAISYSIIIPYSLERITSSLSQMEKTRFKVFPFLYFLFILYWLFLIQPTLKGQLMGTFKAETVPAEYLTLKNFIINQPQFFRILWFPNLPRFRFYNDTHPMITAADLFGTSEQEKMVDILKQKESQKLLSDLGIKYLIIPYDSEREIFITDRKYDAQKRKSVEAEIDKITWLKKIESGKISVYENPIFNNHFWLDKGGIAEIQTMSNSNYKLKINPQNTNTLFFSDSYNPGWVAVVNNQAIHSNKTNEGLNSFLLPNNISMVQVYFLPQRSIVFSYLVSITIFLIIVFYLLRPNLMRIYYFIWRRAFS